MARLNMAPLRGVGAAGAAPPGPRGARPFIAALRADRVDAPWAIDGPTLARGDIVILYNLGSHKGLAARSKGNARFPGTSSF